MLGFLPIGITLVGAFFLIRLRGFFLFRPWKTLSLARKELCTEGKGAFMRMSLALAGTLGVGNVTGVAAGILVGGAGSVFWLLLSALFSAPLKYAESVAMLSVSEERVRAMGFAGLIQKSFFRLGALLSALYALLSLGLAFSMGAALQSAAAVETAKAIGGEKNARICALLFAFFLIFCILGKRERISKVTSVLIPIAMVLYTTICIFAIFSNISRLFFVFSYIIRDAFSPRALLGGAVGAAISSPLREGFLRGLLSNEAGAGTSAYAHAKSRSATAVGEGVLGMGEILFDTVILCMLTAFTVLLSVPDLSSYTDGTSLLSAAFRSVLGRGYALPLVSSVFLFALSTAVCWYEYGRTALSGLRLRSGGAYFISYLAATLFGACIGTMALIPLCDTFLFFLTLISLLTLLKNSAAVRTETDRILQTARPKRTAAHGGKENEYEKVRKACADERGSLPKASSRKRQNPFRTSVR